MDWHRNFLAAALLFASGTGFAATDAAPLTVTPAQVKTLGTLDEQFLRVERKVPGFAGIYLDNETLIARIAKTAEDPTAPRKALVGALQAVFGSQLAEHPENVEIVAADYPISELHEQFVSLHELFAQQLIASLDLDEVNNRITIGLKKPGDKRRVRRAAMRLGAPAAMLRFEQLPAIAPTATLRDRIRPVPGGVQIGRNGVPLLNGCTLGANVRLADDVGFFTASHCTHRMGMVSFVPTVFNQAGTPHTVGREQFDPHFGNGLLCSTAAFPDGCRWSDTVYVRYNNSNQNPAMSQIARLGSWGYGPISTVDDDYEITSLLFTPLAGERLMKVGRTTGKTAGLVGSGSSSTCVTLAVPPAWYSSLNAGLICQYLVFRTPGVGGPPTQPINDNGDSGSPVFRLGANHRVALAGILWGGGVGPADGTVFVMSPMFGVVVDMAPGLGSMTF